MPGKAPKSEQWANLNPQSNLGLFNSFSGPRSFPIRAFILGPNCGLRSWRAATTQSLALENSGGSTQPLKAEIDSNAARRTVIFCLPDFLLTGSQVGYGSPDVDGWPWAGLFFRTHYRELKSAFSASDLTTLPDTAIRWIPPQAGHSIGEKTASTVAS